MSSHIITDSPDFNRTPKFVGHSPDDPDGLHTTLGEDSDLYFKIYRKNGSQVRSFHKFVVVDFFFVGAGRGGGDPLLRCKLVFNFVDCREHWQKCKG